MSGSCRSPIALWQSEFPLEEKRRGREDSRKRNSGPMFESHRNSGIHWTSHSAGATATRLGFSPLPLVCSLGGNPFGLLLIEWYMGFYILLIQPFKIVHKEVHKEPGLHVRSHLRTESCTERKSGYSLETLPPSSASGFVFKFCPQGFTKDLDNDL